jgi:hypothetical protein
LPAQSDTPFVPPAHPLPLSCFQSQTAAEPLLPTPSLGNLGSRCFGLTTQVALWRDCLPTSHEKRHSAMQVNYTHNAHSFYGVHLFLKSPDCLTRFPRWPKASYILDHTTHFVAHTAPGALCLCDLLLSVYSCRNSWSVIPCLCSFFIPVASCQWLLPISNSLSSSRPSKSFPVRDLPNTPNPWIPQFPVEENKNTETPRCSTLQLDQCVVQEERRHGWSKPIPPGAL